MAKVLKLVGTAAVVLAVAFVVGSYLIDRSVLDQVYQRPIPEGASLLLTDADVASDYPSEAVSFDMDGATLRGRVYGDVPDARGLVVFRHGITSHHQDYLALIVDLVDRGWKVFAYDAIGCGESDGDSVLGFAQSPLDVHAAVQFAREQDIADDLPILLFGHSWGGYGVAAALDFNDGVAGCVTMSGFDTPVGIFVSSAEEQMGPLAYTQASVVSFIDWLDFGKDGNRSAVQAINKSGVPVLVIHGTEDPVVGFGNSGIIAQRDVITNPNVRYLVEDAPGRNGHNSYFYSRESQAYLDQGAAELEALQARYEGTVLEKEEEVFLASFDKRRANVADPALMDEIDSFLAECINDRP